MNRRSSGFLLPKAITGFLQFKSAEAVSASTLTSYGQHLRDLLGHVGDVELGSITSVEMCAYMAYLRSEYKPRRFAGGGDKPVLATFVIRAAVKLPIDNRDEVRQAQRRCSVIQLT